ncbi:MAG: hypothetical protein J6U54_10995 [Clostridiales bacterium]|nr:hypothetical protein [Clostridiales bacterium]
MNFVLGLVISAMLIVCLLLEMCMAVRPIFSLLLLGGIIAFGVALFCVGVMLTPLFIFGFLINIPILIIAILAGGSGDVRK